MGGMSPFVSSIGTSRQRQLPTLCDEAMNVSIWAGADGQLLVSE